MRYFLALFAPPIAALIYGGIGSFILNLILFITGVGPWIHALLIVIKKDKMDQHQQMMNALNLQTGVQMAQLKQQQIMQQQLHLNQQQQMQTQQQANNPRITN